MWFIHFWNIHLFCFYCVFTFLCNLNILYFIQYKLIFNFIVHTYSNEINISQTSKWLQSSFFYLILWVIFSAISSFIFNFFFFFRWHTSKQLYLLIVNYLLFHNMGSHLNSLRTHFCYLLGSSPSPVRLTFYNLLCDRFLYDKILVFTTNCPRFVSS